MNSHVGTKLDSTLHKIEILMMEELVLTRIIMKSNIKIFEKQAGKFLLHKTQNLGVIKKKTEFGYKYQFF